MGGGGGATMGASLTVDGGMGSSADGLAMTGGGGTAATMDLTGTEEATTALTVGWEEEVTLMRFWGRSSSSSWFGVLSS